MQCLSANPYSPYSGYLSDYNSESHVSEEVSSVSDQILSEYYASLKSLEHSLTEVRTAFNYMHTLKGKDKEEFIKEWKNYVQDMYETSIKLINSIEDSIQSASAYISD